MREPASPGPEELFRAKSSRDRLRNEIEQISGLRCGAETSQRAIEMVSLQQDEAVDLTPFGSNEKGDQLWILIPFFPPDIS